MIGLMMVLQFGCAKHSVKSKDIPTADSIFAAYQIATVSEEAQDVALRNLHTVGTVEMALLPEPLQVDSWIIDDKGSRTVMTIPGMGEIVEAYNLEYAWTIDPTSGDRLLEGADFEYAKKEFGRAFVKDYSQLYSNAVVVGADVYEDQDVWKITAKDAINGSKATLYFTQKDSLLVGEHRVVEQGKGSMKMKMSYLAYEWVDGMYVPVEMTIKAMGIKQNFKLTEVTINNEVTPDIVIPASIQAFIDENSDAEDTSESEEIIEPEVKDTESDSD